MLLPRAFTLGLNFGTAETLMTKIVPQQTVSIQTDVVFDATNAVEPLRLATPTLAVQKVASRADEEAAKAAEAARQAAATRATTATQVADPGPDLATKRSLVQQIASQQGIDWRLLEAVWQIESGKAWQTAVTSSAGALGPMQFMPGTWQHYSSGGSVTYAPDALKAAAKLLAANGAASGDEHQALFAYNHAEWYVQEVEAIKNSI